MNTNGKGPWVVVSLGCGDGRFRQPLLSHVSSVFGGFPDDVTAPGGVKKFLADETYRKKVLEDIATYLDLHHEPVILVVQHEDCGAYGGKHAFESNEAELECHRKELELAVPLLEQMFPDKRVIPAFLFLDGTAKVFKDLAVVAS